MELFVGTFSHINTDIDFGTTSSLTASFRKFERDRNCLSTKENQLRTDDGQTNSISI